VDVIRIEGCVLSIHLLSDNHSLSFEVREASKDSIIVINAWRPRQVIRSWVLNVGGKEAEYASRSKYLLDALIKEEFTASSTSSIEYWVSPFVVDVVVVEMGRNNDLGYTALSSNFFHADDSLLALEVVFFTDSCSIFQVISAIRPKTPLKNVMSV
jgi:hypothetical protein